jgi:hypothetical protein
MTVPHRIEATMNTEASAEAAPKISAEDIIKTSVDRDFAGEIAFLAASLSNSRPTIARRLPERAPLQGRGPADVIRPCHHPPG